MNKTLRLVGPAEAAPSHPVPEPPLDVMTAHRAWLAANALVVAQRDVADRLRMILDEEAAETLEAGPVADAFAALDAAERRLFAAPSQTMEDLAIKIAVAAECDFECGEANDMLRLEAETILRTARIG